MKWITQTALNEFKVYSFPLILCSVCVRACAFVPEEFHSSVFQSHLHMYEPLLSAKCVGTSVFRKTGSTSQYTYI